MELVLDGATVFDRHGRQGILRVAAGGALVFKPFRRGVRDWVRWASGKSQYLISKILNQIFNATSYSFPATLYAALWTSTLTAASTGATSGEASYTGYARVAVTANTTNFPLSSGGSAIQNATAITFAANAGTLQTATYFAILDALTTGNLLYWGSIASTAINPGDTPQVNVNALTASEA